ncbi:hypothetical protein [[Pseudopropionibacterium] massiliense]|uniref:hypothetical protein n=1 Tax=[Pseudopropionibacterium] massiliense TaxID=2220000 RepID=UPI0010321DF0|nr:hypothetical protein [[Pseudopropionibacterium] massiliense]
MSTPSTPSPRLSRRPCTSYVAVFLALTIGAVWGLCLFYLLNHEFAAAVLGPLVLTNPVVMLVLHSPALAALGILLAYDGARGVANFLRTLVPRRRDLLWLPILIAVMLAYVFAVRLGCVAAGIPVPPDPMPPLDMLTSFISLLWGEVGMVAIGIGWFGVFLPLMHRLTGSHLWSGIATGGGVAVFVAPGNLFSSFNLAIAWPLYALQLVILGVAMSLLLSRMKGNMLFFLIPFWVSASGSLWRTYYFAAATQLVQITLLLALTGILYLVLFHQARGNMAAPHTFPEYLEQDYTLREGAVLPGRGNRSCETATGYTPAARNLATEGAL